MATVTGSYLIARTLKEEGVDTLFYLMGGPNFDIVMSSEDLGINTVDFRHEPGRSLRRPRLRPGPRASPASAPPHPAPAP